MSRLILKELRQLLPIACLWLAVLLLGYFIQFFTERIDEETFASWCEGYCDYSSNTTVAIFSILLALVTAYSLFPREHDEATIDFLRALPVSAASVFVAKVLAAWFLLCGINLLSYATDALLLASNPESIGGTFYLQVWLTLLWRDCLFAFIILSHGVLLSWFRTLGLVFYGIYLLALMWAESALGTSGHWSIFSLLSNEYSGSNLIVNSRGLAIHAGIAILMLLMAYRLWTRTESSSSGVQRSTRGIRVMHGVFSVAGFVVLGLLLAYQVEVGTGSAPGDTLKVSATEHYRFVYQDSRTDVVDYIMEHAEDDLQALGELLGVEELPRIRVDLSASSEHAAGLAKWKKIQMDLNAFAEDVSQRRVLSHETTHVLQAVESDRALAGNYSAVKFFIEGMAQFTSFEIVPEVERRESNWALASVSWKRQIIEFNDLINADGFARRFDAELHYSLGDLWTKALVDTCGMDVLGDFLRAAGRDNAVRDLPASIFWRDTTREIGCDLDTVNVNWNRLMSDLHEQVDDLDYPVYSDIVVRRDSSSGQIRISARLEKYSADPSGQMQDERQPESDTASDSDPVDSFRMPSRFIVRIGKVSTNLAAGVDPVYFGQVVNKNGQQRIEFVIPDSAIGGTRFRYQLGFSVSADARYYYESWRRGTVPRSAGEP